ncbi:MAG TPA: (Fe-S)-binding protein [Chloroflexota bacterium]|nr:(Fe-S)-binding protein [Chloroflexota bacterium]
MATETRETRAMPETREPITLDDARWQKVLDATGGWAAACYQCGVCSGVCPWGRVRGPDAPPVSVRHMVRSAQLGLGADVMPADAPLWLCTTCRLCEVRCPRGVPVTDVVLGLRELAWKEPWLQERVPPALAGVLWDVHFDGNPWGQPPSRRAAWARDLGLAAFNPAAHEALYYVGCTAAYDTRAQHVARALVNVLQTAGVAFGTLGEQEPCCGDAAHSFGHKGYFGELIETNTRLLLEKAGVSEGSKPEKPFTLVTTSPHCFDVFANHYPRLAGVFRPLHYTQYLAELIDSGRLTFPTPLPMRVTFHDPCVLGRGNGEYEAPRRVLAAIPGVDLVEMTENREGALCCGGGGGRMWLETPIEDRFGQVRVRQADQTGAAVLATACPYCISCLEDAIKIEASKDGTPPDPDGMKVLDIAEVAWLALFADQAPAAGRERAARVSGGAR